jgi:hypothetical protein
MITICIALWTRSSLAAFHDDCCDHSYYLTGIAKNSYNHMSIIDFGSGCEIEFTWSGGGPLEFKLTKLSQNRHLPC